MYSRPADPMPFISPSAAPLLVTHAGPFGPSVTWGMRSRRPVEALAVKRSGGNQHRSMWQSAEIISYRIARERSSPELTRQAAVSRRLECYRARIVAPLAMLLSAAYGESHCECARQGRVRASHLSTLPTRKAPGEATDPGRVLPGRRLSPEARHSGAQRSRAGGRATSPASPGDL